MNTHYLNPLRWKKSFLFILLAGILIIWFGFIDTYSIYTRYKLAHQKSELEAKIERMKAETDQLEKKIHELKKNPDLLEQIAREQYGMRKPGEKVYRVMKDSK